MLMHVIARRGCAKTVRGSALRVELEGGGGGVSLAAPGNLTFNPCQFCTWFSGPMFYQVSHPTPVCTSSDRLFHRAEEKVVQKTDGLC